MLINLSEKITSYTSGQRTLLFLLLLIAFISIVMPIQAARTEVETNGLGLPDTMLTYSGRQLLSMAEGYGLSGRQFYIGSSFTFDLAFPIIYGAFGLLALSWLSKKVSLPIPHWKHANLLQLAGLIMDGLENITLSTVMALYPKVLQPLPTLAGAFTLIKWGFAALTWLAIFTGLIALAMSTFRQPKTT